MSHQKTTVTQPKEHKFDILAVSRLIKGTIYGEKNWNHKSLGGVRKWRPCTHRAGRPIDLSFTHRTAACRACQLFMTTKCRPTGLLC